MYDLDRSVLSPRIRTFGFSHFSVEHKTKQIINILVKVLRCIQTGSVVVILTASNLLALFCPTPCVLFCSATLIILPVENIFACS